MKRKGRSWVTYGSSSAKRRRVPFRGTTTVAVSKPNYVVVPRVVGPYLAGEMKYYDTYVDFTIPATTTWGGTNAGPRSGTSPNFIWTGLCCPVVGSAYNNRIGKKIKIAYIKIRGAIVCNPQTAQATTDSSAQVRVLLVQDKQTNGVVADGNQIIDDTVLGPPVAGAINNFQKIDNFGRFRVLKDKSFVLENPNFISEGGTLVQMGIQRTFKWTIRFKKPLEVNFNTSTSSAPNISSIIDNSFHIICNSSNNSLAPNLQFRSRVGFKE